MADTCLLIDYFRKTDKTNSRLLTMVKDGYSFTISAITEYEIYTGANTLQHDYWDGFLKHIAVLPFDKEAVKAAVEINSLLKRKRAQIAIADLFIAATALSNHLPFATLNVKHFERIDRLQIVT